ncbi:YaaL family protein [Bacillus thermotolerans]|uniref:DUF2508 family protein n=1 Tax=Bacillus thermotolerans TaxID=1221996 RepID=A0A0F5HJ44_BACTR|nr:YaaL family protein [Bacillus thermotolerans]KKB33336.1 hypothetical protein QY97_03540 [Bacillus thermotolerans]KKB35823.1 hypothetical protein QY96_03583 [Bacillus thermotolerans]KKB39374.1 hypothetical protein QY95_02397 [Bacillus thermotolerans]
MLFRKKGKAKLDASHDEQLIRLLEHYRQEWMRYQNVIRLSVEPSDELVAQAKIYEAKYFFLFREAKRRNIRIKQ